MVPLARARRAGAAPAFCFARAGAYELAAGGRKLVGSAQRRQGGAFLQHGSVLLDADPDRLRAVFPRSDPLAQITTLAALLRRLADIPGLRWVRLSSVLPPYFTPELLEVVTGSPVVAPHFHIPLQSGSDGVLRRMRRPYNVAMYRGLVERLATAIPRLGLGADLITGFPGESDADFGETVRLIETLPFSYLHVFPYSARKGTEAACFTATVDGRTVSHRARVLRELAREKNLEFRRRLVGSVEEALVLETRDRATGGLTGLTGNYVEVRFDGPGGLPGRLARVRVTAAERDRTLGELTAE